MGRRGLFGFIQESLGEHASVIVRVAQQTGKGRARHGGVGFVHDGEQATPEDLEVTRSNFFAIVGAEWDGEAAADLDTVVGGGGINTTAEERRIWG